MAMKTRRLFPDLSETNQTIDCSDSFCDPACPYNCYPYPDYYYLQPPPPPPLPPPPLSDESHYISPYMIIFVSVLASFLLLVGYYVIVVKSCFGWCCWRNNRQLETQTDASDEEFVDENRVDHPIWFITTVGLQQSIINSITVCKYKKGEGLIEGTECSVCLNEFQEEEAVRLLPKCNHAFHISCIDTWLRAHTNCPLCRAHIVFNPPISADQNSDNIDVLVDNHIEISEIGGQVSGQNPGRNSELCENRARAEAARELPEANDQRISKETIYSDENGGLLDSDSIDRNQFVVKEITQIKRCVSMDSSSSSSSAASLFLGLPNSYPLKSEGSSFDQQENPNSSIIAKQDEVNSSEFRLIGNSSISHHLHLSPVPMKRSFSCSGRFFSSKHCRSMNSILPL